MEGNKCDSITVLGAGIVGVCCALSLQERGYQVTLIDRLMPGEETSYGNAGVISPWSCVPQCMPGTLRQIPGFLFKADSPVSFRLRDLVSTIPWLLQFLGNTNLAKVETIADAMDRLMHNNVASYKRFLNGTGHENILQDSWYLNVFKDEMQPNLDDLAWKLRIDRGAPIRIIGGAELRELEPHISDQYHSAVVIEGQSRTVSPGRLCKVLAEQAIKQGVVIKTADVRAIRPLPRDGYELVCDGETLSAKRLVIAGGIWSAELLRPLGFNIPLISERGYHLEFANPGVTLTHSIADVAGRFVVSSMENGIRAAGTAEFASHNAPANMKRAQMLAPQTQSLLPNLNISESQSWVGSRPSLPDSLPAIGQLPNMPGLFAAFGHSHYGMGMAPATGRLIATMVGGQSDNSDVSTYSPSRFS